MATIPTAEVLGQRPTPRGAGGIARYTPQRSGASIAGEGLTVAGQILEESTNRHDNLVAEDAYNKLQTEQEKLAFDPDTGFLSKKGKDATGQSFSESEMGRFNIAADSIEQGLDGNQKRLFKQRRSIAERKQRSSLYRHQATETESFSDATEQAVLATEIRNISMNPLDDNTFNMSMARIDATIASKGDREGMPPEAVTEAKKAITNDVWESRIVALVDDQPKLAKEYYKKAKKHLDGESRDKIEGLLEAGTLDQESQQKADIIVSSGKSPTAMMKDARKISDPKMRDETVRRVKARISEGETFEKLAQSDAADRGYTLAANGGKIPTTLLAQMSGKTQIAMRKLMSAGGAPKNDDMEVYQAIKRLPPEEFAAIPDMMVYAPYLKESTLKSFMDQQNKVADGDYSVTGDMAKVSATIESLGIPKDEKGRLYSQVDSWAQSLGREPTGKELQEFLDGLQREVVTDGGLWDATKKIGMIKVDGVPDSEIPDIVKALDNRGIEASDENIKAMYEAAGG